jgi:nucleoside-diphosphate-sugar epimerase
MHSEFEGLPVLVTGGGGFIGSHLVDTLLARGARPRVLDDFSTGRRENLAHCRSGIELIEGDIRDVTTCRRAMADVRLVFHEAALGSVPRSMEDPATTIAVNVTGTANVLSAALEAGVRRVVFASSSSVYGDDEHQPKKEGIEGRPLSPYALSKRMDEHLAETYWRVFGLEVVGLRYFNVYGPRQDPQGPYAAVIPRFFASCRAGSAPTIFGDGSQSRDFTFVADVVEANLLAATAPGCAGRAYNVGAGRRTSVAELAQTICDVTGCPGTPLRAPARAGDVLHSTADVEAAFQAFGFRARTSLAEGLGTTGASFA